MTAAESKDLKKGSRVYWRGDATDGGRITEVSWDAVTIAWNNGQDACADDHERKEDRHPNTENSPAPKP
jgi:hypothetical protein